MNRRVLMIAYHYPPVLGSSGVHRTLKFSRYLPEEGWDVTVLTVHPRVYERTSEAQLAEIPEQITVERAFALDSARDLAIKGRYWSRLALPDRWASWLITGIWRGLGCIRRQRPAFIYSTYPIATAHRIGYWLHRLSGLPWIADFRDPMTEPGHPAEPRKWASYRAIEALAVRHASRLLFTTPGAIEVYRERYPDVPAERFVLIGNGYDEEDFRDLPAPDTTPPGERVTLVHSGVLYPKERDPRAFFQALARLKQAGRIDARSLRIVLRATGHDHLYRPQLEALNITDLVELAPPRPYREALAEMLAADGLLLFQADSCNQQIPAKAYEYLRAGRPVLALTDAAGDTAGLLRDSGIDSIVALDDEPAIAEALSAFLGRVRAGTEPGADPERAIRHSRRARSTELARLLDSLHPESRR